MASSFIVGARTNLNYEQLSEGTQRANPKCTICNKTFKNADRVHVLGCNALGHVFHRPCLNPLLAKGRKVVQTIERNCPRPNCAKPIRFDEVNVEKGACLHREINEIPEDQLSSYALGFAYSRQRLLSEYLQTFSPKESLILAQEKQEEKLQKMREKLERDCYRISIIAGIGVGLLAGVNYLYSQ